MAEETFFTINGTQISLTPIIQGLTVAGANLKASPLEASRAIGVVKFGDSAGLHPLNETR